jgi:hypothetical protein
MIKNLYKYEFTPDLTDLDKSINKKAEILKSKIDSYESEMILKQLTNEQLNVIKTQIDTEIKRRGGLSG